jgi:hypothetical protein
LVYEGLRQARNEDKAAEMMAEMKRTQGSDPAPVAPKPSEPKADEAPPGLGVVVLAWAFVFAIALASPFFGGVQNFMGWVILTIALYEAWKLNRRVPVNGPFRFGSALPTT